MEEIPELSAHCQLTLGGKVIFSNRNQWALAHVLIQLTFMQHIPLFSQYDNNRNTEVT